MERPLCGIIPPMITPLDRNDALDHTGLEKLIEHILAGGVHGLFILGTTGEAQGISYKLRHELIERVTAQMTGRVPVLVGITDTSMEESINLAKKAHAYKADAVVAAPPYYFTLNAEELISYYSTLASSIPLPLFIYNMPSHTKINLSADCVCKLATHPNIIGFKDSSGSVIYFQDIVQRMKDNPDFSLLAGPEEILMQSVLAGGHGGVNGGANMFPKLYVDLYYASLEKDFDKISVLQEQVMLIASRVYTLGDGNSSYLKGLKCALSIMGLCKDTMSEPFRPFGAEEKKRVRSYLSELEHDLRFNMS